MKSPGILIFIVCFFSFLIAGNAQEKIEMQVSSFYSSTIDNSNLSKGYELETHAIVREVKKDSRYLSHVEYFQVSNDVFRSSNVPNTIDMSVQFKKKKYDLVFVRKHLKSQSYKLSLSDARKYEERESIFYQGIIKGEFHSWATLAIINGKYKLLLASEDGNIEATHAENDIYRIYESKDLKHIPSFTCEHDDKKSIVSDNSSSTSRMVGSDCLELYIECDYQSFLDNGNDVANTEAWAMSIINDVSTLYTSINVPIVVSEVLVWNSIDPYAGGSSVMAVRDSFVINLQNNYSGRVAQLFSTRGLGGGLAYGLGGLCGSYPDFPGPFSIATSLETSYDGYPDFSFTVNVVAHELGHVFGARHTHACVWGPNFDSQIDDCGNIYAADNGDTPEGTGCFDEMNPILPSNGGTIMSFCNLAGGGIDLANGFGTEVGDFIFEHYSTAPCATGGECATLPPSNDDCFNAIELQPRGLCSYTTYDNINATPSGIADPSCGSPGSGEDVWFRFTVLSSNGGLDFNPLSGEVEDVIISLYQGSCSQLTEIECVVLNNEQGGLKLSGLTVGTEYFVRIIESGSDIEGNFELCLTFDNLPCHPAFNPLMELYTETNGAAWTERTGWEDGAAGSDCDVCNWFGIICDNLGNVIEIDLFNNNLDGTVPASLSDLDKLRSLKLMNNDLSGTFPDIWTAMMDLTFIDLSNNDFTGVMPASLGNLQNLNTLYIENNNLDGELLPSIGLLPRLQVYWVKNNNLSGCYPIEYQNLCDINSYKFTNNPNLPYSGNNFSLFCSESLGADSDGDGFCNGPNQDEDCDDEDNSVYPGAPELCDGKDNNCDGTIDEGIVETNTYISPSSGAWHNPSVWSLGMVPQGCHDVIFPQSAGNKIIEIQGEDAFARSVTINNNNVIENMETLAISGSNGQGVDISTLGQFNNIGNLEINNVLFYGIRSNGGILNSGTIEVSNLGSSWEVYLMPDGTLDNQGSIIVRN